MKQKIKCFFNYHIWKRWCKIIGLPTAQYRICEYCGKEQKQVMSIQHTNIIYIWKDVRKGTYDLFKDLKPSYPNEIMDKVFESRKNGSREIILSNGLKYRRWDDC